MGSGHPVTAASQIVKGRDPNPQYRELWTGTPFAIGVIASRRSEALEVTIYQGS
jgi:hypothetical protein